MVSFLYVTLVNSYSDSDIIAPNPKWFWVTINFFLNFLFIFFSLLKSSKRKDNETCVRFAVWWSDSDQTAALKVKLNVLNRTQLHHSRVSLAGCQLRLWQLQILSDISPPSRDISRWYLLDISRLRQDITATRRTMLFCFKQCTLQLMSAPTMLSVAGLHLNPVCRVFPVFHVDLVERRGYWRER